MKKELKFRERLILRLVSLLLPNVVYTFSEAVKEIRNNEALTIAVLQPLSTYLAVELPALQSPLQPPGTSAALWHNLGIWRRRQLLEIFNLVPPRSPLFVIQGQAGKEMQQHLDGLMKNRFWYPGKVDPDSNTLEAPPEPERPSQSS